MLQIFLRSLLFGALLATVVVATSVLLRRAAAPRYRALPAGQEPRCVRPRDLAER
jgi:hypothetical protein